VADYNVKGKMSLDVGSFIADARRASESLNKLDTSVNKTSSSMKYLKRGALAAATGLGALAVAGVKAASDYQQSMIAFTKMMGSAEKATQFVKELQAFAAKTPFELPQVQAGAKKLMAFGFEAKQVLPMLTAIGNAASGLSLGSEGIDRLTLAIGQMQAKGKVSGGELRQLAEAGIPALQYLADALGKTQAEILDMSEKGAIPASVGVGILIQGMEKGSKNAMGFAGMMEAQSKTMAGLMSTLKDTIRNAFVDGFNKYVPKISESFEKMITKVGPMVEKFIAFMGHLVSQIGKILGGIGAIVKPIFENFLLPAFKVVGAAVMILIAALAKFGEFLKNNAAAVEVMVNILGVAALAWAAYRTQVILVNLATKIFTKTMGLKAKVIKAATKAQLMLNAAMRMNPIGLAVAALTALIAGFVIAWNNSESFRKVIIALGKAGIIAFGYIIEWVGKLVTGVMSFVSGPMRLLLKGLSMLKVPGTKNALEAIEGGIKTVGKFFDKTADSVKGYADNLDKLQNKKFKMPGTGGVKAGYGEGAFKYGDGGKISDSEFDFDLDAALAAAGDGAEGAAKAVQKDMLNVIKEWQDFINNDFAPGFLEGADKARDTILKGLDETKKVFDEFSKGMKGAELKKVEDAYNGLNDKIRAMIPRAMEVAAELEAVQEEVAKAKEALDNAIKSREEGAAAFIEMLAQPFGEPSELNQALSGAEASVGSIIGMYDRIVEAVNKRYEGIDPTGKNALLDSLRNQTAQLVTLARQRDAVAKDLEKAQDALADAISSRKSGAGSIADALKSSFGQSSELANALSDGKTTADSIIGMYERLAEAIEARYAGIDPSGKTVLLTALENQTKKLLELVKKRDVASKALEDAQKNLETVLAKQSEMKTSVTGSMKSYATALASLSTTNSASTIKVIKTATGMVITQMKEGSQGVQTITDQLKTRLQGIKDFAMNIRTLLASGLNKEYIQQLLTAGPEAAGATAALLAQSGQEQINEINTLYSAINAESEAFGTQMADTFYSNSVAMAQAIVTGAQTEYDNIVTEMTRIKDGIASALSPLSTLGTNLGTDLAQGLVNSTQAKYDSIMAQMKKINDDIAKQLEPLKSLGTNLGTDLAQGLYDALKAKEAALIALAKSIADQIAFYMAQAMASIGAMQSAQANAAAQAAAASAAAAKAAAAAAGAKGGSSSSSGKGSSSSSSSAAATIVSSNAAAQKAYEAVIKSGLSVADALSSARYAGQADAYFKSQAAANAPTSFVGSAESRGLSDRANSERLAKLEVQKGAVQVTINGDASPTKTEEVVTRALLNALSMRAE
jgi:tape measure domain-containing protein